MKFSYFIRSNCAYCRQSVNVSDSSMVPVRVTLLPAAEFPVMSMVAATGAFTIVLLAAADILKSTSVAFGAYKLLTMELLKLPQ